MIFIVRETQVDLFIPVKNFPGHCNAGDTVQGFSEDNGKKLTSRKPVINAAITGSK
jgi:hypothetical protein